jgi:hypothetical protein
LAHDGCITLRMVEFVGFKIPVFDRLPAKILKAMTLRQASLIIETA